MTVRDVHQCQCENCQQSEYHPDQKNHHMIIQYIVGFSLVILILITLFLFVRTMLIIVTIERYSMIPTLQPGDRVIALRYWPSKWLKKGDIVVAWPPMYQDRRKRIYSRDDQEILPVIKRIVGLPKEPFIISDTYCYELLNFDKSTNNLPENQVNYIPLGYYFLCGDNYLASIDSRHWGPIANKNILGIVIKVISHAPNP